MARGLWRTKDGRVLLMTEMDDQHLENTIKMLASRGVDSALYARTMTRLSIVNGKVLIPDPEEHQLKMVEAQLYRGPKYTIDRYQELLDERERRKRECATGSQHLPTSEKTSSSNLQDSEKR